MRLSDEEKKELLEDGRSAERRSAFRKIKQITTQGSRSLDDYIQYLKGIQKIFGEFPLSRKISVTRFNKL